MVPFLLFSRQEIDSEALTHDEIDTTMFCPNVSLKPMWWQVSAMLVLSGSHLSEFGCFD